MEKRRNNKQLSKRNDQLFTPVLFKEYTEKQQLVLEKILQDQSEERKGYNRIIEKTQYQITELLKDHQSFMSEQTELFKEMLVIARGGSNGGSGSNASPVNTKHNNNNNVVVGPGSDKTTNVLVSRIRKVFFVNLFLNGGMLFCNFEDIEKKEGFHAYLGKLGKYIDLGKKGIDYLETETRKAINRNADKSKIYENLHELLKDDDIMDEHITLIENIDADASYINNFNISTAPSLDLIMEEYPDLYENGNVIISCNKFLYDFFEKPVDTSTVNKNNSKQITIVYIKEKIDSPDTESEIGPFKEEKQVNGIIRRYFGYSEEQSSNSNKTFFVFKAKNMIDFLKESFNIDSFSCSSLKNTQKRNAPGIANEIKFYNRVLRPGDKEKDIYSDYTFESKKDKKITMVKRKGDNSPPEVLEVFPRPNNFASFSKSKFDKHNKECHDVKPKKESLVYRKRRFSETDMEEDNDNEIPKNPKKKRKLNNKKTKEVTEKKTKEVTEKNKNKSKKVVIEEEDPPKKNEKKQKMKDEIEEDDQSSSDDEGYENETSDDDVNSSDEEDFAMLNDD